MDREASVGERGSGTSNSSPARGSPSSSTAAAGAAVQNTGPLRGSAGGNADYWSATSNSTSQDRGPLSLRSFAEQQPPAHSEVPLSQLCSIFTGVLGATGESSSRCDEHPIEPGGGLEEL